MKLDERYTKAEIEEAADSLFESAHGAFRSGDYHMAKILVGVAQKLWEDAGDSANAAAAEEFYKTIPAAPSKVPVMEPHGKQQ